MEKSQQSHHALKEEKQKLNTLNNQFTQINQHLRNELEKEKNKIIKLKQTINKKDEEIRVITVDILGKEQFIHSLETANEDLMNQLNMLLYNANNHYPASTRYGGGHSKENSIDGIQWKYGMTEYTQDHRSRRGIFLFYILYYILHRIFSNICFCSR